MDKADEDLLHRHLNGDLDAAEAAAFLARLKDSPELGRALAARAHDETLLSDLVREGGVRAPARPRFGWAAAAAAAVMLAGLGLLLFSGGEPRKVPPPAGKSAEDGKLEDSIRRACAWLETRRAEIVAVLSDGQRHHAAPRRTYGELAALALVRAGYSESHPVVEEFIGRSLGRPLESIYTASIRAMLLAEIGPRPDRLRAVAQFLVDSQGANGQWDYGRALPVDEVPPGLIRRRRDGPPNGDNSVTSYAVQGLLACRRAGVEIEADVLVRARRWWLSCQNPDGGWGYRDTAQPDGSGPDRLRYTTDTSYGSGTASGVASLAALREMLGPEAGSDAAIRRGLAWLGERFAADANPEKARGFSHLHWLWGAGRAGTLVAADAFGSHDWFAEGAAFLLAEQQPTGEWKVEDGKFMSRERNDVVDTCLAILFLTRKG